MIVASGDEPLSEANVKVECITPSGATLLSIEEPRAAAALFLPLLDVVFGETRMHELRLSLAEREVAMTGVHVARSGGLPKVNTSVPQRIAQVAIPLMPADP